MEQRTPPSFSARLDRPTWQTYGFAALLSALLSQELFRIPLVVSSKTFLLSACAVLVAAAVSGYLVWRKVRRLDLIEVLKTRE